MSLEHNQKLAEHQLVERGILKEPTGHYSSGVYNNKPCLTTPEEVSLYKFKHKRYNPVMNMTLAYLFQKKNVELKSKTASVDDVITELDKIFGKATLAKSMMLKRFGNSYEPKYGFRVSVNRLHGLPSNPSKGIVHYVVSQFVPPGRLLR